MAGDLSKSRKPRYSQAQVHKKYLLCIDDHKAVLAVLQCLLETFGYSVLTASDGRQGLNLLAANPVDAVIVDNEMPDMNGAAVARAIKRSRPELPVLMFSGKPSELDSGELRDVDSFVPKGQVTEVLLLEIARLLASKNPNPSPSCSGSFHPRTTVPNPLSKKSAGRKSMEQRRNSRRTG